LGPLAGKSDLISEKQNPRAITKKEVPGCVLESSKGGLRKVHRDKAGEGQEKKGAAKSSREKVPL